MKHPTDAALGLVMFAAALAVAGCNPEGVGSVGPPPGAARKDDAYLIPGYNPDAAKALKKKSKAAQSKPGRELPIDLKSQRH